MSGGRLSVVVPRPRFRPAGLVGDGIADDAPAIQAAIDACAAEGGGDVVLPHGGVHRIVPAQAITADYFGATPVGLILPSGVHLRLNKSDLRIDTGGSGRSCLIVAHRATDVGVHGGTLTGDRHAGEPTSDRHSLLRSFHSQRVRVQRVVARESQGAGIQVARLSVYLVDCETVAGSPVVTVPNQGQNLYRAGSLQPGDGLDTDRIECFPRGTAVVEWDSAARTVTMSSPATETATVKLEFYGADDDVLIRNVWCDDNRMNGLVLESGRGITVEDSRFTRTRGTPPEAGVDMEPYYGLAYLRDITFRRCHTSDNAMGGLYVQNLKNARIEGCDFGDGVMFRAVEKATMTGCTIRGGVTIKTAGVRIAGNAFHGSGVGVYNDKPATIYRDPMDVEVIGNTITLAPAGSALIVWNRDDTPPAHRGLTFSGNTITASGDARQRGVTGSNRRLPAFQSVQMVGNTFDISCPTTAPDIIGIPPADDMTFAQNTVTVTSPTLIAGAAVVSVPSGQAAVSGNTVTVAPGTAALVRGDALTSDNQATGTT